MAEEAKPMDFFQPLPVKVPRIAYSVLHQRRASVPEGDYVRTLLELTRLAAERAAAASGRIRAWREAKAAEVAAGAAPETAERLKAQLEALCPLPSVEGGLELATIHAELPEGRLRERTGAGRDYLAGLGFRTGDGEAPVHESILLFTGSWNYDFIEYVVRDQMGIYEDPHLQHVRELGPVIFFTQNQVAAFGDGLGSEMGEWQAAIFFAKGAPRYDEFRAVLEQAMARAVERAGLRGISLWQRKLGMGNIFEWELRLRFARDPERLGRALDVIAAEGGAAGARVTTRGRLLLYEVIG
jgi:hypothetical protein